MLGEFVGFKTLDDIRSKIMRDLDIEVEEFIQPQEIIEYINDAVTNAEAKIINLGLRDKYFFARSQMSIVQGQEDYALPPTIYANKLFKLVYANQTEIYPIQPIDSKQMFEEIALINLTDNTQRYRYMVRHDTPGAEVIQLIPKARETLSNVIWLYYYREANRLVNDTDICDLPEIAYQYIYQSVRVRVYEKEKGSAWMKATADLQEADQLMVTTLQQQIVDDKLTEVDKDFSTYMEHS